MPCTILDADYISNITVVVHSLMELTINPGLGRNRKLSLVLPLLHLVVGRSGCFVDVCPSITNIKSYLSEKTKDFRFR